MPAHPTPPGAMSVPVGAGPAGPLERLRVVGAASGIDLDPVHETHHPFTLTKEYDMKAFWASVEKKVKSAAVGALVASVIAAELDALMSGNPIPHTAGEWVRFLVITAAPPVVAFARGYAAPHTAIPPVQLAPVTPPTGSTMAG